LARWRVEPESIQSLFELLIGDLGKGHYHLAIRHFLMLKGCGATLPTAIERRCEQLMRTSPASRRHKIESDVRRWLDMLGALAPGPPTVFDGQSIGF
jgi:hypothetical protein